MTKSVEYYLIRLLASIAIIAIIGVLAILPYRLYERDVRNAKVQAHQISSLVHTAISEAVVEGRDVSDLINRFQSSADFVMQLKKLEKGEVHPAATSGRGYSKLNGTALNVIAPPIRDKDGNTWLTIMEFDLSNMKRESIALIIDLMLAVVLGSFCFSIAVYILVRKFLVVPLREVTNRLERMLESGNKLPFPESKVQEMEDFTRVLKKMLSESAEIH